MPPKPKRKKTNVQGFDATAIILRELLLGLMPSKQKQMAADLQLWTAHRHLKTTFSGPLNRKAQHKSPLPSSQSSLSSPSDSITTASSGRRSRSKSSTTSSMHTSLSTITEDSDSISLHDDDLSIQLSVTNIRNKKA